MCNGVENRRSCDGRAAVEIIRFSADGSMANKVSNCVELTLELKIMKRMVCLLAMVILSGVCADLDAQVCSSKVLYGKVWVHSHEEDTDAVRVYRPSTFNFPLSRGRDRFEIRKNGTFVTQTVGRSDRLNQTTARWEKTGKSTFEIKPDNVELTPFKLEVVSCNEEKLVLKREVK